MSGLAALFIPRVPERRTVLERMLLQAPERGESIVHVLDTPWCGVALSVHAWQEELVGGSFGAAGDVSVVADASLYYKNDLVRRLADRGVRPRSTGSGDLIAAAVLAWGHDAPRQLEGDFAFIAVRDSTREVVAARDFAGLRPLYFARLGFPGLSIASTPRSIIAAPWIDRHLNLAWLGDLCSGTVRVGRETVFRDVEHVRQGERVCWRDGGRDVAVEQYWDFPQFSEDGSSSLPFDEAALELRRLLGEAVRERLPEFSPAVVSLSGGRDSPALYAAARRLRPDVLAVSLSYPEGDLAREDEKIVETVSMYNGTVDFIDGSAIPLQPDPLSRAEGRPEPFPHLFEQPTLAIADRARSRGARVAFSGMAGDLLFHASLAYLSDLLMSGRWILLARELKRNAGFWKFRTMGSAALLPAMGPEWRNYLALLRGGRRVVDSLDTGLASWIRPGLADQLAARLSVEMMPPSRGSASQHERRLLSLGPFVGRIVPEYSRLWLERDIEHRSPFHDERVFRFAASRPRVERQSGGDHKWLLRRAFSDELPASVTATRTVATGQPQRYFINATMDAMKTFQGLCASGLVLEELGIVDRHRFIKVLDPSHIAQQDGARHISAILFTAAAELWLRRHRQ